MKYALLVQTGGADYNHPQILAELAKDAEEAGWDGFFTWDQIIGTSTDPWVALSAISMMTKRIRIGPMITPVARRRPWKLARETVSIDRLSNGRLTFGVGLGDPAEAFSTFDEESDKKILAQKLDEGLDILTGLWTGEEFTYNGDHYKVSPVKFLPIPEQNPRIPIWVGGFWPRKGPFRRAARYDGIIPYGADGNPLQVDDVVAMKEFIKKHRQTNDPFDIVILSSTPTDKNEAKEIIAPYSDVGVTWWCESTYEWKLSFDEVKERIRRGPPE
ncbi:MAG: LLM class flavin-dependent oxidoreductase [Candidatus Kariarchaeaceae archaeon]